jgi:hypothetical protein
MVPARGPAIAFGLANLVTGAVVALGVFRGLPDRYLLVDSPAVLVILLLVASGAGLVAGARWGRLCARIASAVTLALGLVLVCALALTVSYLAGIYGPVGEGGAVIFTLVLALAIPYLVALPAFELYWLRSSTPRA